MKQPWHAERELTPAEGAALIEAQFPELAPVRAEPLGEGWDNVALRVNDEWVFRFPRREMGAACLENELAVLPGLRNLGLPLPVPQIAYTGRADARFPWSFAGHRLLPGRPAGLCGLTDAQRAALATPVGRFLRALHAVDEAQARALGAVDDPARRMDFASRAGRLHERLDELAAGGVIDDAGPLHALVLDTPPRPVPPVLLHGDLYSCQILVDDAARPCGVIDWGDAHVGDPATDLMVAHMLLPPAARPAFRKAYGPIDEETWQLARTRALDNNVAGLASSAETGDEPMLCECLTALRFISFNEG